LTHPTSCAKVLRDAQNLEVRVSYEFLSDAWFDEVARIREELGEIDIPSAFREIRINIEVAEGPEGRTVQSHLGDGNWVRGHQEAHTTIRLPYTVARRIFVDRDPSAAMQAFMTGQIRVEGDVARLMSLQRPSEPPSADALILITRIAEITG